MLFGASSDDVLGTKDAAVLLLDQSDKRLEWHVTSSSVWNLTYPKRAPNFCTVPDRTGP